LGGIPIFYHGFDEIEGTPGLIFRHFPKLPVKYGICYENVTLLVDIDDHPPILPPAAELYILPFLEQPLFEPHALYIFMTAICIMGIGRSGTSMVSNILSNAGAYMGEPGSLKICNRHNPKGFYENNHFFAINVRVLAAIGADVWVPPKSLSSIPERFYAAGRRLVDKMPKDVVWGWKDPRNTLLFPFWHTLVSDVKVVFCLRNPHEVALSFAAWGGKQNQRREQVLELWKTYNLTGLEATSQVPRLITCHANYFDENRDSEVQRLLDFCGLDKISHIPVEETLYRNKADRIEDEYYLMYEEFRSR
jgi:hypothetical protein